MALYAPAPMPGPRPLQSRSHRARDVVLLLALGLDLGCKAKIGDACRQSTQCSLQGDRVCDLSHRVDAKGNPTRGGSGECTIEGCGYDSCPKEAVCVQVYGSDFLSVACDPTREDVATRGDGPGCLDGVCPPRDDCDPSEVCLAEGLCADAITARTSCRRSCKKHKDCRAGYECRLTGSQGVYRASDPRNPGAVDEARVCMPVGV